MWDLILKGGPVMVPLILCSIVAWGVIIERHRSLKEMVLDAGGMMARLRTLLKSNQTVEAQQMVDEVSAPVASILSAGLRRYRLLSELGRSPDTIEHGVRQAMEDNSGHVVAELEKNLVLLATVANVAPLFGFTGTVTGMIRAFNSIAAAATVDAKTVAAGISEALLTTAAGLIIAIPAFVAYNYYTNKVEKFVLTIDESAATFIEILAEEGRV